MSANYTPNQNEYKNLTPFKSWLMLQINTWGMTNFPFVESDFDELTNYGMLMKMMKALNDVISNQNDVEEDMTNLFNAFTELQTYVNNYFDNLDIEEEVDKKLDEMVEDGTLETIIAKYFDIPQICGATYISGETSNVLASYQNFYNIGGRKAQLVQNVTLNVGTKTWTIGDLEKLQTIIDGVKNIGYNNIMVKIHMNVTNGSMSNLSINDLQNILSNYENILEQYATICENNNVNIFVITNENPYLTTHSELLSIWSNIYTNLRSIYNGKITHSMTLDESYDFTLYEMEDLISFNIYPNLSYNPDATTYECMYSKDLNETYIQIQNIKNKYENKDIIITETGCEHQRGRLANPGFYGHDTELSYSTQFIFYQTILRTIKNNLKFIKDIYLWEICYSFNFLDNTDVVDLLENYMKGREI